MCKVFPRETTKKEYEDVEPETQWTIPSEKISINPKKIRKEQQRNKKWMGHTERKQQTGRPKSVNNHIKIKPHFPK